MVGRMFLFYGVLAMGSMLLGFSLQLSAKTPLASISPLEAPVSMYQRWLGHMDGRPCPSYPACSLYARQALNMHGPLIGSWLIIDRLIHEADAVRRGPWIVTSDGERIYDPLSRNDSWLNFSHK
ncbi:MAG: membrane protein insertion efficiency factor YidD [Mariprofundaceae bacterium]